MKRLLGLLVVFFAMMGMSFAQEYILFYGNGCNRSNEVLNYIKDNDVVKILDLDKKEVYYNKKNLNLLNDYLEKHDLTYDNVTVPFLIVSSGNDCNYVHGPETIIKYLGDAMEYLSGGACANTALTGTVTTVEKNLKQRLSFLGIMLPAALSDSINPCAFAIMLLLLSTILTKHKSRKKAILAGFLFAFAVFLSYLAMGIGLFSALATSTNTFVIKLIVGVIGILVGLINIKDFFRYKKGFSLEIPMSWRPKMQDMIEKISSPWGAFIIGFLVSLFLLPCSSGPYFTILGYLSSESQNLNLRGYTYLIIYNLIFILPMLLIVGLVGFGVTSVEKLAKMKYHNTKLLHLIIGLLMLGLGLYVLLTM